MAADLLERAELVLENLLRVLQAQTGAVQRSQPAVARAEDQIVLQQVLLLVFAAASTRP